MAKTWLDKLFNCIDSKDVDGFVTHLADQAQFRFGNMPPVSGRVPIAEAVSAFFDSIRTLRHTLDEYWESSDALICHGSVVYTLHDGKELCFPFANIIKRKDGLAYEYCIYADISPLYASN